MEEKVYVPPLKIQGIKTKLVPLIRENVPDGLGDDAFWVEPFMGSGAVGFNVARRGKKTNELSHTKETS